MKCKNKSAFSLVEVVVALAIVAFTLIPVLGMVSMGLQSSRESKDDTNIAVMTQTVMAQLWSTGYTNMAKALPAHATNSLYYYFDSSGAPLYDTSTQGTLISSTGSVLVSGTLKANYTCTITNKTPASSSSFAPPSKFAVFRLDFAWPYNAANQRHKYVYTSLAQYN